VNKDTIINETDDVPVPELAKRAVDRFAGCANHLRHLFLSYTAVYLNALGCANTVLVTQSNQKPRHLL
jgi:hypothetical protein